MTGAITKMLSYMIIVALGFFLKRVKVLKASDARVLSKIILTVTLPAVLLTSFMSVGVTAELLIVVALGFVICFIMMLIANFTAKRAKTQDEKLLCRLLIPIYNAGIFGFPIAQAFFSAAMVANVCMFDIGNAFIMFAVIFPSAALVKDPNASHSPASVAKRIFSSIPFDTYILAIILSLLKVRLPDFVTSFASFVGGGNTFLCMLLFGVMLDFDFSRAELGFMLKILVLRLVPALLMSLAVWFVLPIERYYKIGIILCMSMPIGTAATAYAEQLECKKSLVAGAASLSLVVSCALALGLALIWS